ncbi:ATP-binding cassette domain-containing protein [Calycomorphotria hydatis]|uniref:Glycine betaine/carnitine/choline transport ATP-binding protein OpuCA n=1 Tax=Calycomorphotria hydatis TaxID=2528027 RepID=A0A517T7U1_9PLAN|nr:ATP-binding cassette domain-containing protein [Calycomorphotria hydatis]QDT64432.1 Glycine betaine/carnitine/choline transport ATP-binding protein OpuCA [Calycomorphotria hydatis]
MIRLDAVTVEYQALSVLDEFDLEVRAGETTVMIGPSGCGKTTLLRLMIGLTTPNSGSVFFDGDEVTPRQWSLVRRRIGYVIQEGGLFPHLTAGENVALMANRLGKERSWTEERMQYLANLVSLPIEVMKRYPTEMSGGQRQRVGMMRALMLEPEVLLLDEPLGALDPLIRAELQNDLKRIITELKKTVVLVTHDLGEAEFFADRILLLKSGKIVQDSKPEELLVSPANDFVRSFISAQRSSQFTQPTVEEEA